MIVVVLDDQHATFPVACDDAEGGEERLGREHLMGHSVGDHALQIGSTPYSIR